MDTMTKLTFYGGVGEIGGNKILLESEGKRICPIWAGSTARTIWPMPI
jgi:mRNA degradation ribonuclease J1/J2